MKFIGGLPELKARVQLTGVHGHWSVKQRPEGNQHVFTANDGKTLTWSLLQGPSFSRDGEGPSDFERSFWRADRGIREHRDRLKNQRRI